MFKIGMITGGNNFRLVQNVFQLSKYGHVQLW